MAVKLVKIACEYAVYIGFTVPWGQIIYNIVNSTKIDNRQKNPLLKIDLYTAFSKQLKFI